MSKRKGIILAGGTGSRLKPLTNAISKQLLPVYDKPMIYYPLTTLMFANIKDILIIVNKKDKETFKNLLKDGSQWGININYAIQEYPSGIAEAFIIGESFIGDDNVALILGDNLFHGHDLISMLRNTNNSTSGGKVFAYQVSNPEEYGIVIFDKHKNVTSIEEKPKYPKSKFAITGLYFYKNDVIKKAKDIKPSERGELEITSINQKYLDEKDLKVEIMGRGITWLDTGTFEGLNDASNYIRTLEKRQGLKIGCPEEVAWRLGWINKENLIQMANKMINSEYSKYLINIVNE
ncbi:glucose-1-phosphate thymidylyltransferase RfbA [uncultured Prochlorococcus sp.]|uniref:glucose-1-phosphate thymidylyltransferase RfbA n=1 Tax=uncultured Prochlorococcus sp. TaxID=159733 RepID=UPI002586DC59|nr:glucose-1-phosphate thymidylyltransferase RfbA [uncultured Prochlorococcus sp.]